MVLVACERKAVLVGVREARDAAEAVERHALVVVVVQQDLRDALDCFKELVVLQLVEGHAAVREVNGDDQLQLHSLLYLKSSLTDVAVETALDVELVVGENDAADRFASVEQSEFEAALIEVVEPELEGADSFLRVIAMGDD